MGKLYLLGIGTYLDLFPLDSERISMNRNEKIDIGIETPPQEQV